MDALKAYESYEPPGNPKELTTSELQKVKLTSSSHLIVYTMYQFLTHVACR